jgi:hypothetical protein
MRKVILILCLILFSSSSLYSQIGPAWIARYNGPDNWCDAAYAIAIDSSGNVFVTGTSQNIGTNPDYLTIKYYPDGETAWTRRYNWLGEWDDEATAITVDASGNVYVSGSTNPVGWPKADFLTLKYDSSGNLIWAKTFDGGDDDRAHAIAVDSKGNVYVTGETYNTTTSLDYLTIKYYSNGDTAWVRTYSWGSYWGESGYAFAFDSSGNVYVTGSPGTIKYGPKGNLIWARPCGGGNIVLDDRNNIYLSGTCGTVKYDTDGNQLWTGTWGGWDFGVDDSGDVFFTTPVRDSSGTGDDYLTGKYDRIGNLVWLKRYNGPGNYHDWPFHLALDDSNNVYVTGYSYGKGTGKDYATIKYDQSGNEIWVERYNGPGNSDDEASGLAVDRSGNVYVTGWSVGRGTSSDFATIKYVHLLGDANGDKELSISDVVYLINYLFRDGPPPNSVQEADCNCDGEVSISDIIFLINYLFKGGLSPVC